MNSNNWNIQHTAEYLHETARMLDKIAQGDLYDERVLISALGVLGQMQARLNEAVEAVCEHITGSLNVNSHALQRAADILYEFEV